MARKPTTRHEVQSALFGAPAIISGRVLPTCEDVIKNVLFEREAMKAANNKDPPIKQIVLGVAETIISVWKTASIPSIELKAVQKRVLNYYYKYQSLMKNLKRIEMPSFKTKCDDFIKNAQLLFDVSFCKCDNFTNCSCPKGKKVPILERNFLVDQRGNRKMAIAAVDHKETEKNFRNAMRKERQIANAYAFLNKSSSENTLEQISSSSSTTLSDLSDIADDFVHFLPLSIKHTEKKKKTPDKTPCKRMKFPEFALACDRTGVSDRTAALLTSSLLKDIAPQRDEESAVVIDRSKVRRERSNERKKLQHRSKSARSLLSIYFDGRKDTTFVAELEEGINRKRKRMEEHISLIKEPDSEYLGHVTPKSGSAKGICDAIFTYLNGESLSTDDLAAMGCDGTAVNTGTKGGVLRLCEEKLNRPVHWFVCQLHANELPLRHVISTLDGKTSGPKGFTGPIGKQLEKCENLPIVEFQSIPIVLPSVVRNELSTDQQYLFDIVSSISNGECSVEMAHKSPGNMSHARWLTTANRVLRLYVSTSDPSDNLKSIVLFIMKVYAPCWFEIKCNHHSQNGAMNVFRTVNLLQDMNAQIKDIVHPVIQRNAYFAHAENILICMLQDERDHVREMAWRRIKKARKEYRGKTIRIFRIPSINFNAEDYVDLINWQQTVVTEPPLTTKFSDEEIDLFILEKRKWNIENFPCHTQAVERCIKLVTEASQSVCGENRRDGFIRSRIESRKRVPYFNTKKDFLLEGQ